MKILVNVRKVLKLTYAFRLLCWYSENNDCLKSHMNNKMCIMLIDVAIYNLLHV